MSESDSPPSITPSNPAARPGSEGARKVGSHARPGGSAKPLDPAPARPARPAEPAPSADSSPLPPSFAPSSRRPPQRPAQEPPAPAREPIRPATPRAAAPSPAVPAASSQHRPQQAPPPSITPGGLASRPANVRPNPAPSGQFAGGPPPGSRPTDAIPTPAPRPRKRRKRRWGIPILLLLALLLAWPVGLVVWANGQLTHVDALSGRDGTPGTTYLLVGSDFRADGQYVTDGAEGQRSDTILLLHKAPNGQTSLVSLPRDTYVDIPGHGPNKLNAAYSYGGGALLTQSVEQITGITVDHYVEVGMGGVVTIVDAVGGVELCLDYDVNDELSELVWTAGCHQADGQTALAFARMRYSDPLGDFGRQARQRQVIGAIVRAAATPGTILNPFQQVSLIGAGVDALAVSEGTGVVDLGRLMLAFRTATGEDGFMGTPPIANPDYQPGGVGSTVLLDEARTPDFFARMLSGDLTAADFPQ